MLAALLAASTATAAPDVTFVAAPDGVPLCVAEAGNPAGPPIVFIHGYSQTYAVFSRQFDSALAKDFRLLALDMRGHGCSGKPWTESAYAGAQPWADDLATLLREKQVTRPLLVGWSAAGYWIADYVRTHGPDGLAGILLAGSHAGLMTPAINPDLPAQQSANRAANLAYPPDIAVALARGDQFASLMAARPLPDDVRRTMTAATYMLPAYARRALGGRSLENQDLAARFTLPVLFILGDQDRVATPAQLQAVAATLPEARVTIYAGSGHSTFAEEPDRFNADVAAFALRVRAGARP